MALRKQLRQTYEIARQQLAEMERQLTEAQSNAEKFAVSRTGKGMLKAQIRLLDELKLEHERSVEEANRAIREIETSRKTLQRQLDQLEDGESEKVGSAPWEELNEMGEAVKAKREEVRSYEDELGIAH